MRNLPSVLFGLIAASTWISSAVASVPQPSPSTECLRLISRVEVGSLLGVGDLQRIEAAITERGRNFLSLVDLALLNIQGSESGLLPGIKTAADSSTPINPFLNLQSPMGRALAGRSEPLVEMLQTEWPALQHQIRVRLANIQRNIQDRAFDQEATKEVVVQHEIPFDELKPTPSQRAVGEFRYLGQTDLHHVVAVGPRYGIEEEWAKVEKWGAFLISKADRTVAKLPRDHLRLSDGNLQLWVRDGAVVGIHSNSSPFRREPHGNYVLGPHGAPFLAGLFVDEMFRSNMRFLPMSRVKLEDHILARNGQILRTAVGERSEGGTILVGISAFDWNSMEFVDQAQISTSATGSESEGFLFQTGRLIDADRFSSEWISVGDDVKTNGSKTVRRDQDLAEWMAWSVVEGLTIERHAPRSSLKPFGASFRSTESYWESLTITEPDSDAKLNGDQPQVKGRSLTTSWPGHSGMEYRHVLKPLNKSSLGLLYISGTEKNSEKNFGTKFNYGPRAFYLLEKLWLFDREEFKLYPVDVEEGNASQKAPGWWRTIENSNGDILFEYKSFKNRVVELFVLDVSGRKLRKVLAATAPTEYAAQIRLPLVDYDRMELMGWVKNDSLLITETRSMSRSPGTQLPRSEERNP